MHTHITCRCTNELIHKNSDIKNTCTYTQAQTQYLCMQQHKMGFPRNNVKIIVLNC